MKLYIIFTIGLVLFFLIRIIIKNIHMNYLYKQYLSYQHEFHILNEEYVKMSNRKRIDKQTFLDLELYDVLEKIDFTRTTIGGEYLLGSLYNGNKKLDLQEKYIECLNEKTIKEILLSFYYLEKDNVSLLSFKDNIKSFEFKYIMIAMILVFLMILSIIISFIDIFYVRFLILMIFINIIFSMKFLIQYCGEINYQIKFIRTMVLTLGKISKTSLKKQIDMKTMQAVYELNNLLKIEKNLFL